MGEHLPAVHPRKHHIENHQVVVTFLGQMQAIDSVVNQIGVEPCLTQALAQVFAGFDFILDDQYLHGISLSANGGKCALRSLAFFQMTKM